MAYLSARRIQEDTRANSLLLRESRDVLESALLPPQAPKKVEPHVERPSIVETMKDKWNEEVENSIRFVQSIDWNYTRERAEIYAEGLWDRITKKAESEEKS